MRTKVRAERVCQALERVNIKSYTIHGDKNQQERHVAMDEFKNGQNKILIATDVSARGIDIPNVEFVINYDLPDVAENYVHRVGRTGRGVKKGTAISFCSSQEIDILKEIETFLTNDITQLAINKEDYSTTVALSEQSTHDWRSLIKESNEFDKKKKKKFVKK